MVSSIPIIRWLAQYDVKNDLQSDFIAGLTVFVFLIPQGMAYAVLGGLPPVYGLYTATVPLLVYALTGTSRHISLGPMAITSLLLGQMTAPFGFPVGTLENVRVALCISFVTGLLTLLMGVFKLGTLSNFLSPSVLSGFMTGSSCVIVLNQLKYYLGLKMPRFTYSHEIIGYILTHLQETNVHALWIGVLTTGLLWAAKTYRGWYKKMQRHLDDPAMQTLGSRTYFQGLYTASLLSSILSLVLGSVVAKTLIESNASPTLGIVGFVPAGMLPPSASFLSSNLLTPQDVFSLLPTCVILAVVGFTGNWAVSCKYAVAFKYEVDASQELIATGLTNLIGPFFNAFFASGGLARSAVNVESGARSQISSVISAVLIMAALQLCTTWFYYIPMAILAAIIVVSIVPMADFAEMHNAWKSDRRDFVVIFGTFLVTFWVGVREGVTLGLLLSVSSILLVNGFPPIVHLGRVVDPDHGSVRYRNVARFPEAEQLPGTAIVRLDAGSLFFANTAHFKDVVMAASTGTFHSQRNVPIEHVILDGSSWSDIDLAGRKTIREIKEELARKHIACSLCNLKFEVRDKLQTYDLADINDALEAFAARAAGHGAESGSSPRKRKSLSPAEWLARTEDRQFDADADQDLGDYHTLNTHDTTINPMLLFGGEGI